MVGVFIVERDRMNGRGNVLTSGVAFPSFFYFFCCIDVVQAFSALWDACATIVVIARTPRRLLFVSQRTCVYLCSSSLVYIM